MISSTPYQLERVQTFLDPFRDPLDAGYNTIQGLLALALGGITGLGLGASRMKYLYLPAPSTDFIFAIIGEEWGLLGTLTVVALFVDARLPGLPDRDQRAGHVLRPAGRRDHDLAGGPGLRQHDGRHRPAAGHRHPAAVHQLRRVGAHPQPRGGRHPAVDLARDHTRQDHCSMRYLVSGGGTGGHVYPALAVARALRDAQPGLELAYVGGVRGLERRIVTAQAELPYHELMVRSLRSGGMNAHLVIDPLRLGRIGAAGLGAARPPAAARGLHERRVPRPPAGHGRASPRHPVPGLGGQRGGRAGRPRRWAAWRPGWRSRSRRPWRRSPAAPSSPARRSARSPAPIARPRARPSGSQPDDRLLLVFGGSQAVARITDAVAASLARLLADWRVLHIAGEAGMAAAEATRASLPAVSWPTRYLPVAYLTDRMTDALVASRPRPRAGRAPRPARR